MALLALVANLVKDCLHHHLVLRETWIHRSDPRYTIRRLMQLSDLESILSVGRICFQLGELGELGQIKIWFGQRKENMDSRVAKYVFPQGSMGERKHIKQK